MYAIIRSGGKQYKVETEKEIKMPLISGKNIGDEVVFDDVLLYQNDSEIEIGQPSLSDVVVSGKIISCDKEKKIDVLKFKKRKRYRVKQGHRQDFCKVKINSITKN
jgi:large subunit ribosomal protein L21